MLSVSAAMNSPMAGSHIRPAPLNIAQSFNRFLGAVPPTNDWMLKFGYVSHDSCSIESFECGYRIFMSSGTLLAEDLKKLPEIHTNADKRVDLRLI